VNECLIGLFQVHRAADRRTDRQTDGIFVYRKLIRELLAWLLCTVLGCADIPGPANSWTRRHDNGMTIFCRDDDTRYHVVCRDGRWIGRIGSCSNTNLQQGYWRCYCYCWYYRLFWQEVTSNHRSRLQHVRQIKIFNTPFGLFVERWPICIVYEVKFKKPKF